MSELIVRTCLTGTKAALLSFVRSIFLESPRPRDLHARLTRPAFAAPDRHATATPLPTADAATCHDLSQASEPAGHSTQSMPLPREHLHSPPIPRPFAGITKAAPLGAGDGPLPVSVGRRSSTLVAPKR
jgi:hypothetical protein